MYSAEVAVYPIDARGLLKGISFVEITTMDTIGEQTGGRAFYNTNGLKEALETAADDGSSYYSFLYAPTNAKYDGSVRHIKVQVGHGQYHLAYRRNYIADDVDSIAQSQGAADQSGAFPDPTPASAKLIETAAQFGSPLSHQLVFAAHVDAIGEPAPATAEQMAALAPYRKQAAKVAHREFVPLTTPVPMQQYAVTYGVLASQLELPKSANRVYHSDLSIAALAYNEDGETLWGTKARLKEAIPASKIGNIREDGDQALQTFYVPVETAVIRLVVCDEQSGRIGSMEVRLPLPPDQNVR